MTLGRLEREAGTGQLVVPASVAWTLEEIGTARGRQDLYARQAPQILRRLRENAIVESAVSSNRIEGVDVEPSRIGTVVFGRQALRDRDEAEVRGYRAALKVVHEQAASLDVSENTIRELHGQARARVGDAGQYKASDSDIIERSPAGDTRVRFRTVRAVATPTAMTELVAEWQAWSTGRWVAPLVAVAAWNLDFLCVHPFRDGNGRTSRLLLLLQCHQLGYDVGRYISLERLIEENKERYYETLELSSQGWHERRHDPWPFVGYVLFIVKSAYRELENRVGETRAPRGSKTALVLAAIERMDGAFSVGDLQTRCPGASVDLIRKVLKQQRAAGALVCLGRGPAALWRRK